MAMGGMATSSPVVETESGVLLLPAYDSKQKGKFDSYILRSVDGVEWETVPLPNNTTHSFYEPAITQVRRNCIIAVCRTDDPGINMHFSISHDDGKTWTNLTDIGFKGAAPYVKRINDSIMFVSHRQPLTTIKVMKLRDQRLLKMADIMIDPEVGSYGAYPSILQLNNGKYLMAFYFEPISFYRSKIRFFLFDLVNNTSIQPDGYISEIMFEQTYLGR
jgi:hypothetical protein